MVGSGVTPSASRVASKVTRCASVGVEINAGNIACARLMSLEHEMRAVIVIRVRALQAV